MSGVADDDTNYLWQAAQYCVVVADDDIPLPSVPDDESVRAFIATPDPERVVPDLSELFTGPDDISLRSLVGGPAVVPGSVVGYALRGDEGTAAVEAEVREWAESLDSNAISKYDAYYFPSSPVPPAAWEYACETCRFYIPPAESPGRGARCGVVGQDGDLFGGEAIHPNAWCALWLPMPGEGWLGWAVERLESVADK